MGIGYVGIGLVAGLGLAGAAWAQQSETVFAHKHWTVDAVAFDDGSFGCVAQVSVPGDSFSLWVFQDRSIRLQFFSTAWQFDGGTADLNVQIDRRAPWSLTAAELHENSVLFNLPDSDDSYRFVLEVAEGNRLFLSNDQNEPVKDYSLSGSSASIGALIECGDAITASNPF